jgi:hypothetical protein
LGEVKTFFTTTTDPGLQLSGMTDTSNGDNNNRSRTKTLRDDGKKQKATTTPNNGHGTHTNVRTPLKNQQPPAKISAGGCLLYK